MVDLNAQHLLDFDAVLEDAEGFARDLTFGAQTFRVFFQEISVGLGDGADKENAIAVGKHDEIMSIAIGDTVTIAGVDYFVVGRRPDGHGHATLQLNDVPVP